MISMETTSIRSVDKTIIIKLFAKFRSRYGQLWTSRARADEDWEFIIEDWFDELCSFDLNTISQAVREALIQYKEYPPTLGQLVDLCLKATGVPSEDQVISLMVKREFNHPVVKLVYDKIGSWQLNNGKTEEIRAKVKSVYGECLNAFRENPEEKWAQLSAIKEQLSLPPVEHPKIPSQEERRGFKERMSEYYQNLEEMKANLQVKTYREFDEKAITPRHKDFDEVIFNEYRDYLLSIPDTDVMILPRTYMYDRIRFIGMKEQADILKKSGYVPPNQREAEESLKKSDKNGRPTKAYKTWMND